MTTTPLPSPATPPREADLPHALTFFFTSAERSAVLARLRRTHASRSQALLIRLRLRTSTPKSVSAGKERAR